MSMKTITKEVIGRLGELKKMAVSMMCDENTIKNMNSNPLKAMQLALWAIDDASELMEEYANTLDEQNKKLDMILEKLDKKG